MSGESGHAEAEIFCSYSHRDETLRAELDKHLKLLQRQRIIRVWHDRRIGPGEEWKEAIDQHLSRADIVLLLISPDFLASDYCFDVEMEAALEKHRKREAVVIPVILRPVDWHSAAFGRLQALPQDGTPVTTFSNQDLAFAQIASGIRDAVKRLGKTRPNDSAASHLTRTPSWITIRYRDLLNPNAIVRTGQKLIEALSPSPRRSLLQPFLDGYSELLPLAVEMVVGPGRKAHSSVVDLFPLGDAEPAWVALLRAGRIHASTDGESGVRLYLQGSNPERAYSHAYPVVRHCLADLAEIFGREIDVEVYAYEHDYSKSELRLNTEPHSIIGSALEVARPQISIALAELSRFFDSGVQLKGGVLKENENLELSGIKASSETLAGSPLELSDFAVAYRAVFHAGDNSAFVSIDPAEHPSNASVNFGGFLENTRIGKVLLEADKRFKAISTGLDPNSFAHDRVRIRTHVRSFLTSSERELLEPASDKGHEWIGTRFWFYPDSITVHADETNEAATIVNPRFTADAERSRDDFKSAEEYEKKKRELLLLSHRENIDDLNRRYDEYAKAFPELHELDTVARLLAICEWLFRRKPSWPDCDELLSVEIPWQETEKERTRLISATVLSYPSAQPLKEDRVIAESDVIVLTQVLDRMVRDFFQSPLNMVSYLRYARRSENLNEEPLQMAAEQLFATYQDQRVRDLVKTKTDLEALASYAADNVEHSESLTAVTLNSEIAAQSKAIKDTDNEIQRTRNTLDQSRTKLDELAEQMKKLVLRDEGDKVIVGEDQVGLYEDLRNEYNDLNARRNRVVADYNRLIEHRSRLIAIHNDALNRLNELKIVARRIADISGGVSANSSDVNYRNDSSSAELMSFKALHDKAGPEYTQMPNREQWIKSQPVVGSSSDRPRNAPHIQKLKERNRRIRRTLTRADGTSAWRITITTDADTSTERLFDGQRRELRMMRYTAGRQTQDILGRFKSSDHIVFRPFSASND